MVLELERIVNMNQEDAGTQIHFHPYWRTHHQRVVGIIRLQLHASYREFTADCVSFVSFSHVLLLPSFFFGQTSYSLMLSVPRIALLPVLMNMREWKGEFYRWKSRRQRVLFRWREKDVPLCCPSDSTSSPLFSIQFLPFHWYTCPHTCICCIRNPKSHFSLEQISYSALTLFLDSG